MKKFGIKLFSFIFDAVLVLLAFYFAFSLRFGFIIPEKYSVVFFRWAPWVVLIKVAIFYTLGLHNQLWRHASLREAVRTIKSVSVASLVMILIFFVVGSRIELPRGVFVIDWLLTLVLVGGSRFFVRLIEESPPKSWRYNFNKGSTPKKIKKVLIVGAGEAGSILVKKMLKYTSFGYEPVGFLDDNLNKKGYSISGISVLGDTGCLETVVNDYSVDEVIIAIPSASGEIIRKIVFSCENLSVACKTIPGIIELIHGDVELSNIREIQVEDILGRDPVTVNAGNAVKYIRNKTVMVTGAAGFIGSQLCKQISFLKPEKIIALDISENGLYCLSQSLKDSNANVVYRICDVKDEKKVNALFEKYSPAIVFHAAAYKHVPLMQDHLVEAISNNLMGTHTIANLSAKHNVDRFVFISTDKAVNPANIMGSSKALAEKLIITLDGQSSTKFMVVRFGNVLGSSGSVVPLFKEQINKMGPLTITDPNMTRYFMTVFEAVQLVIQAGVFGQGGEIFVLDMGKPESILYLAENMIKLAGFRPHEDIEIKFVGVRPGEKISEELFNIDEEKDYTELSKIFIARSRDFNGLTWSSKIDKIVSLTSEGYEKELFEELVNIFPSMGLPSEFSNNEKMLTLTNTQKEARLASDI